MCWVFVLNTLDGFNETWHLFSISMSGGTKRRCYDGHLQYHLIHTNDILEGSDTFLEPFTKSMKIGH